MGEWPVPPMGRGGKCAPFFQPGGQNPPPHPTLTSLSGLIAHLLVPYYYIYYDTRFTKHEKWPLGSDWLIVFV